MEYRLEYTSPIGKKFDSSPDLLKTRFVYLSGESTLLGDYSGNATILYGVWELYF